MMDEKKIYNAIVRVDDDLIDRSLTRKPKEKTKAAIILSGSCIAIVACMVLCLVIFKPASGSDRFSTKGILGNGTFNDANTDRVSYQGIHFYESLGKTYMIYSEYRNRYEFDENAFHDTGVKVAETQFFTVGEKDGYTYVGGVFHCVGGSESGLFRVELSTGQVEKIIDSSEIVACAAIIGDRLYYVTYIWKNAHTVFEDRNDVNYYLKCADLATKHISLLYESKNSIYRLKIIDGIVYFQTKDSVFRINDDNSLNEIGKGVVETIRDYSVFNGNIYIYKLDSIRDDQGSRTITYSVYLYSADGQLIGSVSENNRFFSGSSFDELTVYNGRIAAFDEDGMYLLDVKTGNYEQIYSINLREASDWLPERFFQGISKTVYNGKLYYNFGSHIIEYSPDGVRSFDLEEQSDKDNQSESN